MREQVIALAGLFQSVTLVQQVARKGNAEPGLFETSMDSLLHLDAESVEAVYGSRQRLVEGLRTLCRQLGGEQNGQDAEVTGYAASLLYLERKLSRDRNLVCVVRDGIDAVARQIEHFPSTHDNVVANFADVYTSTVSTLKPRIMVQGEPEYLSSPGNANRIRALLLSGIRAAVLWHQLGGNRLRLLLSRRRMVTHAEDMLAELD